MIRSRQKTSLNLMLLLVPLAFGLLLALQFPSFSAADRTPGKSSPTPTDANSLINRTGAFQLEQTVSSWGECCARFSWLASWVRAFWNSPETRVLKLRWAVAKATASDEALIGQWSCIFERYFCTAEVRAALMPFLTDSLRCWLLSLCKSSKSASISYQGYIYISIEKSSKKDVKQTILSCCTDWFESSWLCPSCFWSSCTASLFFDSCSLCKSACSKNCLVPPVIAICIWER